MDRWTRFLRLTAVLAAAVAASAIVLIALLNPYGNLPGVLPFKLVDGSQRYLYPAVARSGRYDSLVIGTSTARLLDPAHLEAAFGGRFANLAFNNGQAWEQMQIAEVFLRVVPRPRTLVVGLDYVWCTPKADSERTKAHFPFPAWQYDDDPWNDLPHMFNRRTLAIAAEKLLHHAGLKAPLFGDNGFAVFTPPEGRYDAARIEASLAAGRASRDGVPHADDVADARLPPDAWRFPALTWLDQLLAQFGPSEEGRQRLLVFMPVHVAAQPLPGSPAAAREAACKEQVTAIGTRRGAKAIDFRIESQITADDLNYWDALHYRIGVAEAIVTGIRRATDTGENDPAGTWRVLGR
jgi:hypothetical protein